MCFLIQHESNCSCKEISRYTGVPTSTGSTGGETMFCPLLWTTLVTGVRRYLLSGMVVSEPNEE
ncbi:hypothetical protein BS78_03G037200 [Paspalum vaginatum]|nr:hypothetical protein BS78_03G037200 [Paspalum vaginatum]